MNVGESHSLIINADDFGMNASVNNAILKSIMDGLVTTTTIMVNLEGFEDACVIAEKNRLRDRVGLHINLTQGVPVTAAMKKCPLFCGPEGNYIFRKNEKRIFRLDSECKCLVFNEINAQIRKCRKAGIPIRHADSHNHIHEEPGMMGVVMEVLKKNDIPYLRRVKDMSYHSTFVKRAFRAFYNRMLELNGLSGTDYFGAVDEYLNARNKGLLKKEAVLELMVHPGDVVSGKITDHCTYENLTDLITGQLSGQRKITYYDLRKASR